MKTTTITLSTLKEIMKWESHPHRPAKAKFAFLLHDDGNRELVMVFKSRELYRSQLKQWAFNRLDAYQMIGCLSEVDMSEIEHWNNPEKICEAYKGVAA